MEETIALLKEDASEPQEAFQALEGKRKHLEDQLDPACRRILNQWPTQVEQYRSEAYVYESRDKEVRAPLTWKTFAGTPIPKVSLPRYKDPGEVLTWALKENVPG